MEVGKKRKRLGKNKGIPIQREQVPLVPALWRTTHSIQGVSAAMVFVKPPDTAFARALLYVMLSRCTTLEGLHLLRELIAKDFIGRAQDAKSVIEEYERLRQLPSKVTRDIKRRSLMDYPRLLETPP